MIHFKIRRNTQLKKLMQAYCQQTGLDISVLRFTFDGTRLGPESTPLEVRYCLYSCILVYQARTFLHGETVQNDQLKMTLVDDVVTM